MRTIKRTYTIVTNESARDGDFAECGELDSTEIAPDELDIEEYEGESAAAVALAVKFIGNCVEASDYPKCHAGHTWYTDADGDIDYSTGDETRNSYHLDGFSDEEELAIYAELTGR